MSKWISLLKSTLNMALLSCSLKVPECEVTPKMNLNESRSDLRQGFSVFKKVAGVFLN